MPSSSSQLSSSGSSSSSTAAPAGPLVLQAAQCSVTRACRQPPVVFLPKLVYDVVTSTDSSGLPKAASLLPSPAVMWASSFRPLLSKTMTSTEQSLYYRQWTVPRPSHMDYGNRAEGRVDGFHPRRLLLSGPPQVGAALGPGSVGLVITPRGGLGADGIPLFTSAVPAGFLMPLGGQVDGPACHPQLGDLHPLSAPPPPFLLCRMWGWRAVCRASCSFTLRCCISHVLSFPFIFKSVIEVSFIHNVTRLSAL